MIKIGIIGCGHWGPNYIRCFKKLSGCEVVVACDLKEECFKRVKEIDPNIDCARQYQDFLKGNTVDAVVVATPARTHYQIVKDCLEAQKDVLAEKPLTLLPERSLELVELAGKNEKILMVSHTFLYNPGIVKLKEIIKSGELGKIYYINATRTHLGLIRDDVNALWDLAPHDVSIFNYLTESTPIKVNAVGASHLKKDRADVAFVNLIYPDNIIANIHVSWVDSNKERTVRVVGSKARVVFNDLDNLERIKVYKKGIGVPEDYDDFGEFQLHLRDGDIISPMMNLYEPLSVMCAHFLDCVASRSKPLTCGQSGYEVVRVMKYIEEALLQNHIK